MQTSVQSQTQWRAAALRLAAVRETTVKRLVGQLVDTAFSGSVEGLVMALLEGRGLSKNEAARIRAMIRQAEREKP